MCEIGGARECGCSPRRMEVERFSLQSAFVARRYWYLFCDGPGLLWFRSRLRVKDVWDTDSVA